MSYIRVSALAKDLKMSDQDLPEDIDPRHINQRCLDQPPQTEILELTSISILEFSHCQLGQSAHKLLQRLFIKKQGTCEQGIKTILQDLDVKTSLIMVLLGLNGLCCRFNLRFDYR